MNRTPLRKIGLLCLCVFMLASMGLPAAMAGSNMVDVVKSEVHGKGNAYYLLGNGRILFSADCEQMRADTGKTVEQTYLEVFGYA